MKTPNTIPRSLLIASMAVIAATTALHATTVENTLPVPMPDFMTPAQLVKWRAETTAKTVAKEAAQADGSRLSTVDSSTFSLNSGVGNGSLFCVESAWSAEVAARNVARRATGRPLGI